MAASDYISLVEQIYVGFYGRPADANGLEYWTKALDEQNGNLDAILSSFATSEEAESFVFADSEGNALSNAQLIENIYQNLFSHAPDADGKAFYLAALEDGSMSLETIVKNVADGAQNDDQVALANKVSVAVDFTDDLNGADYGSDDILDARGLLAAVDATQETVDAANAAAADLIADMGEVTFDLTAGLADLAKAEDAVADYNTANPDVASDLADAISDYDGAVSGSHVATDSEALFAAHLSDQQTANADALADAQKALATANEAVAKVAGLTAAVAADAEADAAVTSTAKAAAVTQTALNVAEASWDITSLVDEFITSSNNTAGVLTAVTTGAESPITAGTTLTLTEVDGTTGLISLTDADSSWSADQVTFFKAQQASAADFIAAFNADVNADVIAANAVTAAAATQDSVDFLDAKAGTSDELALVGAGFTVTEVVAAATPTEAEIANEVAALAAAVTAANTLATGTQAALDAATAADNAADKAVNDFAALVAAYDAAVLANAANTAVADSYDALTAHDADAYPTIGSGSQAEIIAANATTQIAIDLETNSLADAASATEATLTEATSVDSAADLAATAATKAANDFDSLVSDFDTANDANPLTGSLDTLKTDVTDAETAITDLADDVAALAAAQADAAAATALDDAVTAAEKAITDEGFALPEAVDAVSEFGTAEDDIFMAGTVDSSIFSFNLVGEDTLYVGTDATYNDTLIGSDAEAGETLLAEAGDVLAREIFLVENGADVDVVIEAENYGSETGDFTTIKLVGVDIADVTLNDGFITVA